jgi:hypothetical protein
MILSDRELRAALHRDALRITPDPPPEAWSSTALDLRLAKELVIWKSAGTMFRMMPALEIHSAAARRTTPSASGRHPRSPEPGSRIRWR